jgi:amino-acid N-acetyltransferase
MNESTATTSSVIVEPWKPGEETAVTKLLIEVGLPVPDPSGKPVQFLLARQADNVVGCIGWESYDSLALLRSFAVSPDLRGTGIGSLLLKEALAHLVIAGVSEFYLLTESAADFASRFGFTLRDRCSLPSALTESRQFVFECGSSAQCMSLAAKQISQNSPKE